MLSVGRKVISEKVDERSLKPLEMVKSEKVIIGWKPLENKENITKIKRKNNLRAICGHIWVFKDKKMFISISGKTKPFPMKKAKGQICRK